MSKRYFYTFKSIVMGFNGGQIEAQPAQPVVTADVGMVEQPTVAADVAKTEVRADAGHAAVDTNGDAIDFGSVSEKRQDEIVEAFTNSEFCKAIRRAGIGEDAISNSGEILADVRFSFQYRDSSNLRVQIHSIDFDGVTLKIVDIEEWMTLRPNVGYWSAYPMVDVEITPR